MTRPIADVIVAGAGPVGLTLSLSLASAGVHVTLIEKREALGTISLASTFHPPTLDILHRLGVSSALQEQGQLARLVQYRSPEGIFAEFDLGDLAGETAFPYRIHIEQSRLTPMLLARLQTWPNARVMFGCELLSVEQGDGAVTLQTRHGSSRATLTGRYLVAADGARSQARQSLALSFDGIDYPDKILRLMTREDLASVLPGIAPVTYLWNGDRSVSFLKMPDCWRIILRVPKDIPECEASNTDWIFAQLRAVLPGWQRPPEIFYKDIYGVSRRMASAFRFGRAYLAGDAAHITNTRGGMNMNCGIHDAAVLARAMIKALPQNRPDFIDEASDSRRRIVTEKLLVRTDRSVAGGAAWADLIRQTAANKNDRHAYMRKAAMLDMVESDVHHA